MRKNAVVFILLCLAITFSAPALGQKKRAKDLFDKGVAALERRNFKNALNAFEEAYEISPHWAVLAHIGTCHANMNHPIEAIKALEQYLEDGGNNIPEDERETAQDIINHQRRKVGVLVLSVEKDGVEAMVDGKSIGNSPFKEKLLPPGGHEVAVVFGENDIVKRNFQIDAGQEYLLRIEQEEHLSTSPPPPPPSVTEPQEETPPVVEESNDTALPTFSAPPTDTVTKKGSLRPFFISLGFTVASAAVAGVGWGFYAHYTMSESNYADYLSTIRTVDSRFEDYTWESTCTASELTDETEVHFCNTEKNRRDFAKQADTWFIVGIAGAGATVVSGTLAIVFYALRHRFGENETGPNAALHFTPFLTRHTGGLQLNFQF